MPLRNPTCSCGHIKSHHKESMKNGIRKRGECEQWNCHCMIYQSKI
jgi:hypothetical protein